MKKRTGFFWAAVCLGITFSVWAVTGQVQTTSQVTQAASSPALKLKIAARFVNATVTAANPFKPVHLLVKPLPTDKPIVHQAVDFYQESKDYEDLFSKTGKSMLCGPASLANALVYLKFYHEPKFEKIGVKHADQIKKNGDYIPVLYKACHTDREEGTTTAELEAGAKLLVAEGGYGVAQINERGAWAENQKFVKTLGPQDLTDLCQKPAKAVVLLFGWYGAGKDDKGKLVYQRNGGHFVFLAGYDGVQAAVFYVSNPLVDYSTVYPLRYSKIRLEPLAGSLEAPEHMGWHTHDLVGGNFAILENMLVVQPTPGFSAPKVAK